MVSFVVVLLLGSGMLLGLAMPSWFVVGNYVVYDSQFRQEMGLTTLDQVRRAWGVDVSGSGDMEVYVETVYRGSTLKVEIVRRMGSAGALKTTESEDVYGTVRSASGAVIGTFSKKGYTMDFSWDSSPPDFGLGLDPGVLRSSTRIETSDFIYNVLGEEDVNTPMGVRRAYHLLGTGKPPHVNATEHLWSDAETGIILRSQFESQSGTYGSEQYNSVKHSATIREANFDITVYRDEPWYHSDFFGIPVLIALTMLAVSIPAAAFLALMFLRRYWGR